MTEISRILPPGADLSFADHLARGGGEGLRTARRRGAAETIALVDASGLRGRGGAGFPTGRKWLTVAANRSALVPTPVVVNAAEGEPGTFKDRQILRSNPHLVLEGALIAAEAAGAREVVIALKASFTREGEALARAIEGAAEVGWTDETTVRVVEGPSTYLFGEETALLEVIEGRPAFPRVAPPYRRGLQPDHPPTGHSSAGLHLAVPGGSDEAPALIDNVETLAHVALILRHGPEWFRSVGTTSSAGTIVCTITGATARHGVGEVAMGTTLRDAIDLIGGGARPGRHIIGALPGVSNPLIGADALDTPLTYEDLASVGSGLGSAGFIVLDDHSDLRRVAADVARFLAVESCGQCEPCKSDGLALSEILARPTDLPRDLVDRHLTNVARGARCALAGQTERVVGSLVPHATAPAVAPDGAASTDAGPGAVLPMVDLVDGTAVLDTSHLRKQPDWSFDDHDSGVWPAQRLADQPVHLGTTRVPEAPAPGRPAAEVASTPFAGLHASHRDLEVAVDRLRAAAPDDRTAATAELHDLLSSHLDVTRRFLHPATARIDEDLGDDIIWYPEAHEREALRLLDRIQATGTDAPPRLVDELGADVHRYVIEVELRILPLLQAHLDPAEVRTLDHAIETDRAARRP